MLYAFKIAYVKILILLMKICFGRKNSISADCIILVCVQNPSELPHIDLQLTALIIFLSAFWQMLTLQPVEFMRFLRII